MKRLFLLAAALVLSTAPSLAQDATRSVMTLGKPSETSATAAPATSFLVNIVADPSFEAGRPPAQTAWTGTNPAYLGGSPIFGPTVGGPAVGQTGNFYAVLGSSTDALESGATQQVNVPAGTYTVSFRLRAGANAGAISSFFITLGSTEIFRATEADVATYSTAFVTVTRQLTVTTGGVQTLSLLSSKPAAPLINWFVDDVSIEVPVTGPGLAANPATLAFGTTQTVGTTSAPQTVTLTNNGTAATTVTGITSSNPAFAVTAGTFPVTIAPAGTATFTVTFSPTNTTAQTGNILVASNAPGSPLTISVTGTGFVPPTPPANDNIANAIVLTGTTGTLTGTNVAATLEAGEPVPTCQTSQNKSVWWRYTPATAGRLSVNLSQSPFDTVLTFHQPGTTQIACDDDSADPPNGLASVLTDIQVTAGTPVLIRVAGFGAAGASGVISGTFSFVGTTAGEGTADAGRTSLTASPNPVRDAARVRFTTATATDVTVAVYDVTGRQVATLFQGAVAADQTVEASLNAANLPAGVYVVRATGVDVNLTQRVTVVR